MSNARKAAVPTLQIENDRVIVTEWRFAPGAETTWHKHGYDYVVVPQTTGRLMIESTSGESTVELTDGISYAGTMGVEHNVVNVNAYEFVFLEIELK